MKKAMLVLVAVAACVPAERSARPDSSVVSAQPLGIAQPPPPTAPDESFRAQRPPPSKAIVSFVAPVPVELKLKNGARVLVVENHALPLVAIELAIPAGADVVPLDKAGLSKFVATMLTEGTRRHPRGALAEWIGDQALLVESTSTRESVHLRVSGLSQTTEEAVTLLAEVLTEPAFAADDVERVRGQMLTAVARRKGLPGGLAWDESERLLFGAQHPLGQPYGGTSQSLPRITRADLVAHHERWYRPNDAVIVVAGDITPAAALALLESRLAGWKPQARPRPKLPALPELRNRVSLIELPGTSQSEVWVLSRWVSANDPDLVPAMVVNNLLGGIFDSRLNLNLREDKSWAYGVYSAGDVLRTTGLLELFGSIETPFTAEALAEYYKEVEALGTGPLREGELDAARGAIIYGLPSRLETNARVAEEIAQLALDGRPLDSFRTLADQVAQVDEQSIARVVKKYLAPGRLSAVVVGQREGVQAKLEALNRGPVEVVVPP